MNVNLKTNLQCKMNQNYVGFSQDKQKGMVVLPSVYLARENAAHLRGPGRLKAKTTRATVTILQYLTRRPK
jgi:hypothetical protein